MIVKATFSLIFILFSAFVYAQEEITFNVILNDSDRIIKLMDPLDLRMSIINNQDYDLEITAFDNTELGAFNSYVIDVNLTKKLNTYNEEIEVSGFGSIGETYSETLKNKDSLSYSTIEKLYCGDRSCFDSAGTYTLYFKYYPFSVKVGGKDFYLIDSIQFNVEGYTGIDSLAYEFLKKHSKAPPAYALKSKYSNVRYASTYDHFITYPETQEIYEAFAERFQESEFYPWILLQLANSYIDEIYLRHLGKKPDFEKSGILIRKLFKDFSDNPLIKWKTTIINTHYNRQFSIWKYRND